MNPSHRTHRLRVTLAGLTAAALALPACQGTATAASHPPHHAAQQAQPGLTFTDLQDLAKLKRDLFRTMTQQAQPGLTFTDLQDLANVKRGLPEAGRALPRG
jgi:hypothetical protein